MGHFRPLAGFELSKEQIYSPSKVEIQANLGFVSKIVYKVLDTVLVVFAKM